MTEEAEQTGVDVSVSESDDEESEDDDKLHRSCESASSVNTDIY